MLIPHTEAEVRTLLWAAVLPRLTTPQQAMVFSQFRRRHQAIAREAKRRRKIKAQL